MANSSAFNTTGAVPKQSMYNPFGNTSSGVIGTINKATTMSPTPVTQGTTPGVIKPPNMTPYQGSFAQQQGTITSAPKPTTPVKSIVSPDGSKTEYHAPTQQQLAPDDKSYKFNTLTGQPNPNYVDPNAPKPEVKKPISSAVPQEQIQNVGQAGQQTANEAQTQGLLTNKFQQPIEGFADKDKAIQDITQQLADLDKAEAEQMAAIGQAQGTIQYKEGQGRILQQLYLSKRTALTNQMNALTGQLGAWNTQQSTQQGAAQSAYTGAQTQAQRGLSAQGTVLNAGLYQPTSIGQLPYSAITGQAGGMLGGQGGLSTLGALQQQQAQGSNVQNMIGAYNQASPLIETAKQQIASAGFNISPVALVNQLQQYVNKGIVPSAEYANIFNTLSEIATTISPVLGAQGAQTDLKTMISQEFIPKLMQGQDIGTVLDNIEKNALAKINALKTTSQGAPLTTPSGSSTGGFAEQW